MRVLKSRVDISGFVFYVAIFSYALNLKPIALNLKFGDVLISVLFLLFAAKIFDNAINVFRSYRNGAYAYAVFIFSLLAIGIFSSSPEKHLTGVLQYMFVYFILVPVILFFVLRNFDMALRAYISGAIVAAVLTLSFNYFGIEFASGFVEYSRTGGRIYKRAGIGGINDFGFIIATAMVMVFMLNSRERLTNISFVTLMIFLSLIIVLTASRSSLVLLILFFGLIALKGRIMKSLTLLFALISLVYVSYDYVDVLKNVGRFSLDLNSVGNRLEQYSIAHDMILNDPFGIGLGSYMDRSITEHPVHNIFLILAVEGGVLSSFSFFIFWIILMADSLIKKPNGYVSFAIIFAVLVYMQTITHVYDRFFWIIIAVAVVFAHLTTKESKGINKNRGPL